MRVLVAAAVFVLGLEGVALACSPPLPTNIPPPCDSMSVYTPGETFPVDLAANGIRLSVQHHDGVYGYQSTVEDAFPLKEPLKVFLANGSGGFDEAPFTFDEGENLVKGARTLHLTDAKPGHYYIAWPGDTCKTQASPAGSGKDVDDFTLTASVPSPSALGTLVAKSTPTTGRDFKEGEDGMCRPVMIHVDETEVTFTLTPSPDLAPWADAITTALEVDGKIMIGFAKPRPDLLKAGQYSIEVTRTCASDTPRYLENPGIAEGAHKARMLARVDGQEQPWGTPEVSFEVHCDLSSVSENSYVPAGDGGVAKAPGHDEGCNASGGQGVPPSLFALLGLAVAASAARRARSTAR